ncbi:MAG: HEXXH motif-containing putative peptide modification protein [Kofleriaceae bacterium]
MSTELLEIVTWAAPSREPSRRRVEHLRRTASHLSAALRDLGERFDRRERADALLEEIEHLAERPLLRVLGAPELCWAVSQYFLNPTPRLLDDVEEWLVVEDALAGGARPARGGWSALGDEYFADPFAPAVPDPWGLPLGDSAYYSAPVRAGIVLDFRSPSARRTPKCNEHRAIRMEAPVPMSAAEHQMTVGRITAALRLLETAAPRAFELVTAMTKVIVPRRDSVHPEFYTSASLRTAIGRTALNNPFGTRVTQAMLASSLVHEAIHAYLYIDEHERPLVTDWDRAFAAVVTSPWTGGALTLPTYLHACYVWHGLYNLWSLPSLINAVGEAPAHTQRQRAAAGFARGALAPIAELRALVSPGAWRALERMHHETLQHAA